MPAAGFARVSFLFLSFLTKKAALRRLVARPRRPQSPKQGFAGAQRPKAAG